MTAPMPDDRTRRMRIALVSAIAVLAVAIVAMVGWAWLRPKAAPPRQATFTPAEETSPSASSAATTSAWESSGSVGASATQSAGAAPEASDKPGAASAATGTVKPIQRAARIAYRSGGSVYVAAEDGSGAKVVAPLARGPFALSPDGTVVAAVDDGKLMLIPVGGKAIVAGSADAVAPVWMPDSSAVLFVRTAGAGTQQVFSMSRAGGRERLVGQGALAAVSADGSVVALLPADGGAVSVSRRGGRFSAVKITGGDPIAVALGTDRMFVSTLSAAGQSAIWSMGFDGSNARQLVGPGSAADKGATYAQLLPAPDGSRLLYTAESDDGYSRMWMISVVTGAPAAITSRRDSYPLGWNASGSAIFFIEGNAFQGEETVLLSVSPDGSRRRTVVVGATL